MLNYLILLAVGLAPFHQAQPSGHWMGVWTKSGDPLPVAVEFSQVTSGWKGAFTSTELRVQDIPFTNIKVSAGDIDWDLVGDRTTAHFHGKFSSDVLSGTFMDGNQPGTFSLHRSPANEATPYRKQDVTVPSGKVLLSGTLLIPKGAHLPGVVFMHGAGPENRYANMFLADWLARHGIAALVYDKRGVGKSTGDWQTADYNTLAGDAANMIRFMAKRGEIDPKRVGLYGHSQGGLLAPLVVSQSPDVKYVLAGAAAAMGPQYLQDLYRVKRALDSSDFPAADQRMAYAVYKQFVDTIRSGRGKDRFFASVKQFEGKEWFTWLSIPAADDPWWTLYPRIASYDAIPLWRRVKVPVLLFYGQKDALMPVAESSKHITEALKAAGNMNYAVHIFPGADHTIRIQPASGKAWPRNAPGFVDLVTTWILARR